MDNPHRWLEAYPQLGTGPIAIEPYISPDWYEREREKIFRTVWLCVGRANEIPNPGDYKVKKLAAANTSAILIRGKDGQIRAFHNICAHRGNTVITEAGEETFGRSKSATVTCRFHGWVYDAVGGLRSVPSENRFYDCFDKRENGLTPIHLDSWEGFLFVNLAEKPDVTLVEFLGEYAEHFAGFPFDELSYGFQFSAYLDCNWKVGHDAFAEAYHVDTIHAGSYPNVFSSGLQNVKLMGPHRSCAVCLSLNASPPPTAGIAHRIAGASLLWQKGASMLPQTINPDRRPDFAFELSVLFPNTLLHVAEGIWFTHQFWPIAHNKTLWEGHYYVRPPKTNSQRWAVEQAVTIHRNALLEDTATMENTHRAMQSRAKTVQHLQDDEILIRHSAAVVDQYVHA